MEPIDSLQCPQEPLTSPYFFPLLWRCGPTRAMPSSMFRFLDHTTTHHFR